MIEFEAPHQAYGIRPYAERDVSCGPRRFALVRELPGIRTPKGKRTIKT